jgi:hypothetical protein
MDHRRITSQKTIKRRASQSDWSNKNEFFSTSFNKLYSTFAYFDIQIPLFKQQKRTRKYHQSFDADTQATVNNPEYPLVSHAALNHLHVSLSPPSVLSHLIHKICPMTQRALLNFPSSCTDARLEKNDPSVGFLWRMDFSFCFKTTGGFYWKVIFFFPWSSKSTVRTKRILSLNFCVN